MQAYIDQITNLANSETTRKNDQFIALVKDCLSEAKPTPEEALLRLSSTGNSPEQFLKILAAVGSRELIESELAELDAGNPADLALFLIEVEQDASEAREADRKLNGSVLDDILVKIDRANALRNVLAGIAPFVVASTAV